MQNIIFVESRAKRYNSIIYKSVNAEATDIIWTVKKRVHKEEAPINCGLIYNATILKNYLTLENYNFNFRASSLLKQFVSCEIASPKQRKHMDKVKQIKILKEQFAFLLQEILNGLNIQFITAISDVIYYYCKCIGNWTNSKTYWSDLHTAVCYNNIDNISHLLQNEICYVDQWNNEFETPLYIAVHKGYINCAQFLILNGARRGIKSMIQWLKLNINKNRDFEYPSTNVVIQLSVLKELFNILIPYINEDSIITKEEMEYMSEGDSYSDSVSDGNMVTPSNNNGIYYSSSSESSENINNKNNINTNKILIKSEPKIKYNNYKNVKYSDSDSQCDNNEINSISSSESLSVDPEEKYEIDTRTNNGNIQIKEEKKEPQIIIPKNKKVCDKCTYFNYLNAKRCEMCDGIFPIIPIKKTKKRNRPPKTWQCTNCNVRNNKRTNQCICGTGKPSNKNEWKCIYCTRINHINCNKCPTCKYKRIYDRQGDWQCKQIGCYEMNRIFNMKCTKCHQPKIIKKKNNKKRNKKRNKWIKIKSNHNNNYAMYNRYNRNQNNPYFNNQRQQYNNNYLPPRTSRRLEPPPCPPQHQPQQYNNYSHFQYDQNNANNNKYDQYERNNNYSNYNKSHSQNYNGNMYDRNRGVRFKENDIVFYKGESCRIIMIRDDGKCTVAICSRHEYKMTETKYLSFTKPQY